MDERAYVEDKQDSWKNLSESVEQIRKRGPGSLSREQLSLIGSHYRAVVSDLSFARTQGASEELVTYLNDLAGRAHGAIYASSSARLGMGAGFLLSDFPRLFRSTCRYTLVAALIFIIAWGTAAYLIYTIPQIRGALIPEQFNVQKTKSGDNGTFAGMDPASTSSFIMTNNVKEGIEAFAGGVTAGVYTVFVLFKNGLVIGAVMTVAWANVSHLRLLALLLPHGFIELMAIFICGGAGLLVGSAMIAPGNMRRADSIRIAAGKALRLFAGTLPFFVVAATIEGFITPSAISSWSKLVFSALTVIALVIYLGFGGSGKSKVESEK